MKNKVVIGVKFGLFAILFLLLSKAGINGNIFPFAFSMLFALAWANQKIWIIIPSYLVGAIAGDYSFEGIMSTLVTVVVLAVAYYVHISLKKPMLKWELFLLAFFSQVARVIFDILAGDIIKGVLTPFIAVGYLYILLIIFEPLLMRGLSYKLTLPEVVAGGLVLVSLGAGLSGCDIYGYSLLKMFVAFSLLVVSNVTSAGRTVIFSSLLALGGLLENNNPIFFAPFLIWALAVVSFKFLNRYISVLALILAEIVCTFYFNIYYSFSWLGLAPVLAGALIFCLLPKKVFDSLSTLLSPSTNKSAVKCMLNRNREIMERRLNNLGEVFF